MGGTLVCAIVGQAPQESALDLAFRVAGALDLRLSLVDVRAPLPPAITPPVGGAGVMQPVEPAEHDDVEPPADLHALAARAGVRPDEVRSVVGDPVEELARMSHATSTAMLVVADSGHGPAWSWLTQDAARAALREVACPMLLVSGSAARQPPPDRVVAAVGDDAAAREVADVAAELAGVFGTPLELVSAILSPARPSPLLEECAARVPREVDVTITVGEPPVTALLARVLDGRPSAIVVLGAPAHGLLGSALLGSAVHWTLAERPNPVVVVPRSGEHASTTRSTA